MPCGRANIIEIKKHNDILMLDFTNEKFSQEPRKYNKNLHTNPPREWRHPK